MRVLINQQWARIYSKLNSTKKLKPLMLSLKDWYHRQSNIKKRRFYAQFLNPGDLCFDVGSNVGNRVDVFLSLGCKVVAVEPQSTCLKYLKRKYENNERVIIVDNALDENPGSADLFVCNADAISSMSSEWINSVKKGRYKDFQWNKRIKVSTTTLDALISKHGRPAFCKIDVEGFELNVLKGLSKTIPFISFEYSPERIEQAKACIKHLAKLGKPVFNYSEGETMKLVMHAWVSVSKMLKIVESLKSARPGDIYVKFEG